MKKLSRKNRLNRTLKIADTSNLRPWGVAPNPTRDLSLDPLPGLCPDPSLREAGKGRTSPFSRQQDNPWALCQWAFAAYPRARALRYSTVPLTTAPLHLQSSRFTGNFITDQPFYGSLLGSLSPEPVDDITVRAGIQLHVKAGRVCLVVFCLCFVSCFDRIQPVCQCIHLLSFGIYL